MRRALLALTAIAALAGCEVYAPAGPDEIARARYVSAEAEKKIKEAGGVVQLVA